MGSYPSNISTGGGSFVVTGTFGGDQFRLYDNGIFRAYGSFVYAEDRIRIDNDTEFTIIDCDAELEDGVSAGEVSANFGARQQITYDRTRVHHTGAVGIKLYSFNSGANAASYSLNKTRVEKCTYGFQLGNSNNLSPILKDVQIDTCTYHIVPNLGNANITFVNPDFTVLRAATINSSDITTLAFRYNFKVQNASSVAIQNAKVFIVDQNNDIVVNVASTDANGLINSHLYNYDGEICLQYATFSGLTKTNRENHTRSVYKYGFLLKSDTVAINQDIKDFVSLLPDFSITESNKATVDAYPITVSIVTNTINVTGDNTTVQNLTSAQLYDLLASYLEDNFGSYTEFFVTRSGDEINATGYNVNLSYINYTGDMVTDQVITLSNGSLFNGVRTDANGTIYPDQPISITNISAGSRLRIYNVTTGVETVNTVVSGTSYTSSYQEGTGYNDGDTVRVYLTKLGKDEWVGDVIDTSNGFNVLASQVDNDVYAALGVDGATITKFQADYPNNEVDLIVGSNWTMAELYAWWAYNLTTEEGIRNFFGGITAIDIVNFRINTAIVDLYLDNTTNASYKQTDNRRFFRDTGDGYPVRDPTTSGYGLDAVWRGTVTPYYNTLPPTVTEIRTELDNNSEKLSAILEDTNELNTTINYSESDEVFDETASNEL